MVCSRTFDLNSCYSRADTDCNLLVVTFLIRQLFSAADMSSLTYLRVCLISSFFADSIPLISIRTASDALCSVVSLTIILPLVVSSSLRNLRSVGFWGWRWTSSHPHQNNCHSCWDGGRIPDFFPLIQLFLHHKEFMYSIISLCKSECSEKRSAIKRCSDI